MGNLFLYLYKTRIARVPLILSTDFLMLDLAPGMSMHFRQLYTLAEIP